MIEIERSIIQCGITPEKFESFGLRLKHLTNNSLVELLYQREINTAFTA